MNSNEQVNKLKQLQNLIQQYQPLKRKEQNNDYLCPSKYKSYQNDNEFYLLNYIHDQPITENDLQTISQFYTINYMSLEYLIFLFLLNYHPITNTINVIQQFIDKYSINSNQEVTNIITTTQNQLTTDNNQKELFLKYLFNTFSISSGKRNIIKENVMENILQILYSDLPLYQQFITFLKQKNHYYLTKDQWNCLSSSSHIVFIPQQSDFYLTYTTENMYFYPVLFDEFFLYLKQLILNHQINL